MKIYLDHAATTPILPEVKKAMEPFYHELFGNPSSMHTYGRNVRAKVDQARSEIATHLHAKPSQIIFTSGGTESDNLALMGVAFASREKGKNHLITTQVEHHAVLDTCYYLENIGFQVTYLPVDEKGQVTVDQVAEAIRPETALISIMFGNNEVGALQPINQIGYLAREKGVFFHCDAVQALSIKELQIDSCPIDLLSLSAHKIGGPKGIGVLFISDQVQLHPQHFGGGQERKRRAGTENVMGIVGFAEAVKFLSKNRKEHHMQMEKLRDGFIEALSVRKIDFHVNGHETQTLPHICHVSFPQIEAETMLIQLDLAGIACASGSACTSGTHKTSHVLQAMQLAPEIIHSGIRFSFGYRTTKAELETTAEVIQQILKSY